MRLFPRLTNIRSIAEQICGLEDPTVLRKKKGIVLPSTSHKTRDDDHCAQHIIGTTKLSSWTCDRGCENCMGTSSCANPVLQSVLAPSSLASLPVPVFSFHLEDGAAHGHRVRHGHSEGNRFRLENLHNHAEERTHKRGHPEIQEA